DYYCCSYTGSWIF
nr:immunoglobulin light chain junction region [Macaca mulatta]